MPGDNAHGTECCTGFSLSGMLALPRAGFVMRNVDCVRAWLDRVLVGRDGVAAAVGCGPD